MRFIPDFAFDGLVAILLGWGRYLPTSVFHTFLETLYCTAEITAEIAKFPGTEHQYDNYQND